MQCSGRHVSVVLQEEGLALVSGLVVMAYIQLAKGVEGMWMC